MSVNLDRIRNFSIIAHIDHGKSTLADRMLELTGTVDPRKFRDQYLDKLDVEREKGITVKASTVRLNYRAKDGKEYIFNMIDTPGHVDFSYEVSRSLSACEGALLLVDATQGVEAQTLANAYLAIDNDLEIIPVINKIDLPSAHPEEVKKQIEDIIGLDASEAILVSAKDGTGVIDVMEAIVNRIPPPSGSPDAPLKTLVIDSWFDSYRGVVLLVRVFDGVVKAGDKILLMATGRKYEVQDVGIFAPDMVSTGQLGPGEVGYIIASIKVIGDTKVGDTITHADNPVSEPLPGFKDVKPMVFSSLYPSNPDDYQSLREALEKLSLNDASLVFEPENSVALGHGFRCGFLGLLHMEIVQERLEREFGVDLVTTAPSVMYYVVTKKGERLPVKSPRDLPPPEKIEHIEEPFIDVTIHVPGKFVGPVIQLCEERRGTQKNLIFSGDRAIVEYEMPLSEVIFDFYDRLKSITRGYASMDYQFSKYKPSDLVKLDILVNGEPVDALSLIVHKDQAYYKGRALLKKLKELIPRQLFEVVLQASIGKRIIAREVVKPLRKDVLAKCYGGDITRKRKLLEKQKEGKKRMKKIGRVEIPQEAFLAVFKIDRKE